MLWKYNFSVTAVACLQHMNLKILALGTTVETTVI